MAERPRKKIKVSISEDDVAAVLQRYSATTVLALLKEVARSSDSKKLDWKELVKNTETGISNAREYQMLWRHLAYKQNLPDEVEDRAEPLDDDSDLEYELTAFPPVSHEASAEVVACVKVMMESDSSDSGNLGCTMVEAPLMINVPNGHSSSAPAENSEAPCSMQGINITVPICVQKQPMPALPSTEGIDPYGTAGGNMPLRRKRKPWTEAEDVELIAAVEKYGEGNWANILRRDFKGDRTASQLSQRWAIIRKKKGNKNVAAAIPLPSTQLSEAQLAARNAMNLALNPPVKRITSPSSVATAGEGVTPSSSVRPKSNAEVGSSVQAGHQSQPAGTSLNSKSSNSASPNVEASSSIPVTAQSQQAGTGLKVAPNKAESGSEGPVLSKSTPVGTLGLSPKSRLIAKKTLPKPVYNSDSMVIATAVAAGARIATQSVADSVIKAAKNVHIMPTGGGSLMKSSTSGGATAHLPGHPNVHYIRTGRAATPHPTYSSVTTSAPCSGPTRTAPPTIQRSSSSISSTLPNVSSKQTQGSSSSLAAESPQQDVKSAEEIKGSPMNNAPKEQVQEEGASVADSSSNNVPKEQVRKGDACVAGTPSAIVPEEQVCASVVDAPPSKIGSEEQRQKDGACDAGAPSETVPKEQVQKGVSIADAPSKIVPEERVQKDVCVADVPSKIVPEERVQNEGARVTEAPSKIVPKERVPKEGAHVAEAPSKIVPKERVPKEGARVAEAPSKIVPKEQVKKEGDHVVDAPSKIVLEERVQKEGARVAEAPSKIVPKEQVKKEGDRVADAPSKIVLEERVQTEGARVAEAPSKIVPKEQVKKEGDCVVDAPSKIVLEERVQTEGAHVAEATSKIVPKEQVQKEGDRVADAPSKIVPKEQVQKGDRVADAPSKIVPEKRVQKERVRVIEALSKIVPKEQVEKEGDRVVDAPSMPVERVQTEGARVTEAPSKIVTKVEVQKEGDRVADTPSKIVPEERVQTEGSSVSKNVSEEQLQKDKDRVADAPSKVVPEEKLQKDGHHVADAPSNRFQEGKPASSKQAGLEEETIVEDLSNSETRVSTEPAAVANKAEEGQDSNQNYNKTEMSEDAIQDKNKLEECQDANQNKNCSNAEKGLSTNQQDEKLNSLLPSMAADGAS